MFYETLKAHENGSISSEQAEWLINCHATLGEALMYIYTTTSNEKIRNAAKKALVDTGGMLLI